MELQRISNRLLKAGDAVTLYGLAFGDSATPGTAQVETLTVVGTITQSGTARVTVTSAAMPASPLTVDVNVENTDTAAQVAAKVRTALGAEPDIIPLFTVGGSSANVSLTRKVPAANDSTLNIAITNGTCTGLTPVAASTDTTAGVAGDEVRIGGAVMTVGTWTSTEITGTVPSGARTALDSPYGAMDVTVIVDGVESTVERMLMVYNPTNNRNSAEITTDTVETIYLDGIDIGYTTDGYEFKPSIETLDIECDQEMDAIDTRVRKRSGTLRMAFYQDDPEIVAIAMDGTYDATTRTITNSTGTTLTEHSVCIVNSNGRGKYFPRCKVTDPSAATFTKGEPNKYTMNMRVLADRLTGQTFHFLYPAA